MEVFQSSGEEGVLTICLDGAETVRLNFKQKVQVSVSYTADNGSVSDKPRELKKETPPVVSDEEKKTDPLDDELNIVIERVKNDERGNNGLFSNPAGDIFGESIGAVPSTENNSDVKACLESEDGTKNEDFTNASDDDTDCDNAMDDDCESFDDHDIEAEESVGVSLKDKTLVVDGVDVKYKGKSNAERNKGSKSEEKINQNQNNKSEMDSAGKDNASDCDEDNNVEIISSSKRKSVGIARDNSIAKLVREVAEKKNIIKKTTSAAVAPLKGSSNQRAMMKTIFYKCNLCQKRFSDSYLLSIHQRAENAKVMCKKCDLECMSRANLIIHEHLMHSKSGRIAGKMCPVCAKPFGKHSDILSHIRSQHTNEGLYKCCVCYTIFQSYTAFKSHLDSHNRERIVKETKSNPPRGNQKRDLDTATAFSRAQQSSSGVAKKMPRMSKDPVSSASKRKSQTPMQHRSLMNYQQPAKSQNTFKGTPPLTSVRPTVQNKLSNSLSVKPVMKSPAAKIGTKTASPKLAAKVPPLSISLSKSKASPSPAIKKQVLASRLKPLLTPSKLSSLKRPLNQLPGGSVKPTSKLGVGRGPLKTLPRVNQQSKSTAVRKSYMSLKSCPNPTEKLWKCHFCERVFRTKGDYINHKKPSRIIQMCKECGFTSTSKALYMIHEYQKHTNKSNDRYTVINEDLRCHICEEPITLNEVLNHVMSKHTGEHPYECCVCKKPAKAYEDWVSHGKSHVRSKEEKSGLITKRLVLNLTVKTEETQKSEEMFCNLCKQYHANEKEFVRHHKSETQKKECDICRTVCFTEAGYLIHRYITHGLSAGGISEDSSTNLPSSSFSESDKIWHEDDVVNDNNLDSVKCPNCLESFPQKDLLSHVMTVHTQESPYKCCTCKATIPNLDQYIDHCDFHLGRKLYSRGTQRCLVCGLRFESRIRLARHKIMHKPTCPYCHVEFNSKALHDVHLKNFHTKDMTPCSFCGKLFAESNQLAEHERNHFFYKKSPCPVCGLTVTNVNKHVARVHPKPDSHFLCNLCGQKFTLKCDLSRHMSKHSNDRKHECDICKKTFKRAAGLRRHAQSHLQNRKFHECHICGKKCSQRNNLSVHMRVHSTTKAFTCEHCGQGFNYNQSLQTHIRKKHTEEPPSLTAPPETKMTASALKSTDHETRRPKQEPVVMETMNQMVNNVNSTQPNNIAATPLVNYQDHAIPAAMYPPTDSSQHYYPDPSGYVPVNAVAFHRSYNDLINTIVRSEHDNNNNNNNNNPPPGVPQQNYPMYYPQF